MNRVTFNTLLEEAELTKEGFSKIVELKYTSVNNWGSSQNVPHWVESWMNLYVENQKYKKLKKAIKESGACDSLSL